MPSDVAEAATQDQLAESLMSPVDQGEAATGAAEEPEVQETAAQETEQEETSDWLPDEQEKVFPDQTLEQYAEKRYPKILEMLRKDPDNADLRQLLHDKVNTDIHLRKLAQQQELEPEEEPEPEVKREEPTPTFQEHLQRVQQIADQVTDPQMAQAFASQFMQAFGVKEAPTPEMATALTRTMTTFGLNLLNTVLPQMLTAPMGDKTFFQSVLEQSYEGFGESYRQSMYERTWEKVRASDPKFASLPRFNDPDSTDQREAAAAKYAGSVDDFIAMQFTDKNGKPLSPVKTAEKKYGILARVMLGEKVAPAEAARYIEVGKKAAERNRNTRQAVSSGRSDQQIQSKAGTFQTNSDLFDPEALDLYHRQHGRL